MADEIVKVIRIESDGAEQTVASLVNEIKSLTEAMNGVQKGTEEYTNILKDLIDNQDKLSKAMKTSKQETTAAEGSYNALVKQMAALKKQWRETTDEASRKELGNQIKDINTKLKDMDASIGNFQRNVGNYADGVKGAFGQMGGAAKGMVGPLNSVKAAFSALSAHPLVAVLTALAALLINGIAKGFKSSEENTNKLRVAFSGFQAIGDAVTKIFQTLAGWIAKVAEATINFADKLGLLGPKFKQRQEMMKKQIALEKQERDLIVKNAELETEAAELRAKASDEENYTIEQRIQFLQEAQAKEEEQLQLEKEILEQKVAQLEAQLALTDSTGEELTKLNELKAQVIQVNAKIAQSQRSTNKEITALRRRGLSEQQQANQARLNLEKDLLQQEYDLAVKASDEQLRLAKELRKKELDIQLEGFKTKIKNRSDYEKAVKLAMKAYNQDIQSLEMNHQQVLFQNDQRRGNIRLAALRQGSSQYYEAERDELDKQVILIQKAQKELKEKLLSDPDATITLPELFGDEKKSMLDLNEAMTNVNTALKTATDNYFHALETEATQTNQIVLAGTRPLSEMYKKQMDQIMTEIDTMATYSTDRIEKIDGVVRNLSYEERVAAKEKELTDATKNYWNAVITEHERYRRTLKDEFIDSPHNRSVIGQMEQEVQLMKDANRNYIKETLDFVEQNREIVRKGLEKYYTEIFESSAEINGKSEEEVKQSVSNMTNWAMSAFEDLMDDTDVKIDEIEERLGRVFNIAGDYMNGTANGTFNFAENFFGTLFKTQVLPEELTDAYLSNLEGLVDKENALLEQRLSNWVDLSNAIGKLTGGIGDCFEAQVDFHKEKLEADGKLDDKERQILEDQYNNTVKPMRIAEAFISTVTGAIDAFTSAQKLGPPMGPIIGGINAAAVVAMGAANIAKIANTNPYKSNSSGLSGGDFQMSATVQPTVSDYNPEYTSNLTGRSDTDYLNEALGKQKLFVSVVDINDAQERGRVRVAESSF